MTRIDWRRYAEISFVNFGWSPAAFWAATPADFWCAYGGWQKMRGKAAAHPLSRVELNALVSQQERG